MHTYYIKIVDGKPEGLPVDIIELRNIFRNISLPNSLDQHQAADLGYAIFYTKNPEEFVTEVKFDETIIEGKPNLKEGAYYQTWTTSKIEPHLKQQKINEKWEEVRLKRNSLLALTDHMMLPDYPIDENQKEKLITYRKALRNLTEQPDPFVIIYPKYPLEDKY